jgi:hypothetical protein
MQETRYLSKEKAGLQVISPFAPRKAPPILDKTPVVDG